MERLCANSRGQRKSLTFIGEPFLALGFVLIWMPPIPTGSVLNGVCLAIVVSFLFFFFAVLVWPYIARLPEITADLAELARRTSWQEGTMGNVSCVEGRVRLLSAPKW